MPLACHYAATGEDSFDGETLLVNPKPVAEALYDMEAGGYHRGRCAERADVLAWLRTAPKKAGVQVSILATDIQRSDHVRVADGEG